VDKGQAWLALYPLRMGPVFQRNDAQASVVHPKQSELRQREFFIGEIPVWSCKDTASHKKLVKEAERWQYV
jgi:hypothetical protein